MAGSMVSYQALPAQCLDSSPSTGLHSEHRQAMRHRSEPTEVDVDDLWGAWQDVRERDLVRENADRASNAPKRPTSAVPFSQLLLSETARKGVVGGGHLPLAEHGRASCRDHLQERPASASSWLQKRRTEVKRRREVTEIPAGVAGSYTVGGSSSSTTAQAAQRESPGAGPSARPAASHLQQEQEGGVHQAGNDPGGGNYVVNVGNDTNSKAKIPSRFQVNTDLLDLARKGLSPNFRVGAAKAEGRHDDFGRTTRTERPRTAGAMSYSATLLGMEQQHPPHVAGGPQQLPQLPRSETSAAQHVPPQMSPIVEESSILTDGERSLLEKKRKMCEKSPGKSIFALLNRSQEQQNSSVLGSAGLVAEEESSVSAREPTSASRSPSKNNIRPSGSSPAKISAPAHEQKRGGGSSSSPDRSLGPHSRPSLASHLPTARSPDRGPADPEHQESDCMISKSPPQDPKKGRVVESPQRIMERLQKRWREYLAGIAAEEEARQRQQNWKQRMADVEANRMSSHDRHKFFTEIKHKQNLDAHFQGQFLLAQAVELIAGQGPEEKLDAALRYRVQTLLEKAVQVSRDENVAAMLLLAGLEEEEKNYQKARVIYADIVGLAKKGNEVATTCLVEVAEFRERQMLRDAEERKKKARKKTMMRASRVQNKSSLASADLFAELALKRQELEEPVLKYSIQEGFIEPMRKALLRIMGNHPADRRHLGAFKREVRQQVEKEDAERLQYAGMLKSMAKQMSGGKDGKSNSEQAKEIEAMRKKLLRSRKDRMSINTILAESSSGEEQLSKEGKNKKKQKKAVDETTVVEWIPQEYYDTEKTAYKRQIDRGYEAKFDETVTCNAAGVITFHTQMARASFGQQRRPRKQTRGSMLLKKQITGKMAQDAMVAVFGGTSSTQGGHRKQEEPPEAGRLHVKPPRGAKARGGAVPSGSNTSSPTRPATAPAPTRDHHWSASKGFDVLSLMQEKSENYKVAVRSAEKLAQWRRKKMGSPTRTLSASPNSSPGRGVSDSAGGGETRQPAGTEEGSLTSTRSKPFSVRENAFLRPATAVGAGSSATGKSAQQAQAATQASRPRTSDSHTRLRSKARKPSPKKDPDEVDYYEDLDVVRLFPIESGIQRHDPRRTRRSYGLVPLPTPAPPLDDFAVRARPPE